MNAEPALRGRGELREEPNSTASRPLAGTDPYVNRTVNARHAARATDRTVRRRSSPPPPNPARHRNAGYSGNNSRTPHRSRATSATPRAHGPSAATRASPPANPASSVSRNSTRSRLDGRSKS